MVFSCGPLGSSYSWIVSGSSSLSTSIQERFLALGKSFPRAARVKGRRLFLSVSLVDLAEACLLFLSALVLLPGFQVAPSSEESSGSLSLSGRFGVFRGRPLPRLPGAGASVRFGGLPRPRRGFALAGAACSFLETFAGRLSASAATEGGSGVLEGVSGREEGSPVMELRPEGSSLWSGSEMLSSATRPSSGGGSVLERSTLSFSEESRSQGLASPPSSFCFGLRKVMV